MRVEITNGRFSSAFGRKLFYGEGVTGNSSLTDLKLEVREALKLA